MLNNWRYLNVRNYFGKNQQKNDVFFHLSCFFNCCDVYHILNNIRQVKEMNEKDVMRGIYPVENCS